MINEIDITERKSRLQKAKLHSHLKDMGLDSSYKCNECNGSGINIWSPLKDDWYLDHNDCKKCLGIGYNLEKLIMDEIIIKHKKCKGESCYVCKGIGYISWIDYLMGR